MGGGGKIAFTNYRMQQCIKEDFSLKQLIGADFTFACIHKLLFVEADITDASLMFTGCWATEFQKTIANRVNFSFADCWKSNFSDAIMKNANFTSLHAREVKFCKTNLQGSSFRRAQLWDANLRGANLQDVNFRGANLRGADFTDANIEGADFTGADMWETVGLEGQVGRKKFQIVK